MSHLWRAQTPSADHFSHSSREAGSFVWCLRLVNNVRKDANNATKQRTQRASLGSPWEAGGLAGQYRSKLGRVSRIITTRACIPLPYRRAASPDQVSPGCSCASKPSHGEQGLYNAAAEGIQGPAEGEWTFEALQAVAGPGGRNALALSVRCAALQPVRVCVHRNPLGPAATPFAA